MSQTAPDGTTVALTVFYKGKAVATLKEYTVNGKATFTLSEQEFNEDDYNFEITAFGNTARTGTIHYGNKQ